MKDSLDNRHFDAIVIGSGISGGWAAKELCEHGLKTLMLERGKDVKHIKDYPTAHHDIWQFEHHNRVPLSISKDNPIVSKCYAYGEDTMHFFTKDSEQPYIQEQPFDWIRSYQVGGKSLTWARQVQRWSDFDFEGPARDGFAVDWPIRYKDIAPWYSHVERFIGVSGKKEGNTSMPDGEFLPPFELNSVEKMIQRSINTSYTDRQVISGRCAHVTKPQPVHLAQGRTQCMARSLCNRGCPFGGYFSSNASTIPWATKTGKLTLRPDAVVESILYDDIQGKAIGVQIVDRITKEVHQYYARVIFLNASALASNQILLNSKSQRFPSGLGNDNGLLGRYVAFHNYMGHISAEVDGFEDKYYYGRRPTQPLIPNFRNVHQQDTDFLRGYASFFSAYRNAADHSAEGVGADYKDALLMPGKWRVFMMMQGETIPHAKNHVRLSDTAVDGYGIPQLITSVGYQDNDYKSLEDFLTQGAEMLDVAGAKNIQQNRIAKNPGLDIHEMGGVRMGHDPKTSILNKWNQVHSCPNVFVTDGACMTSTGTHNPSLTFMALTTRAVDHAVSEMKKNNI